MINALQTSVSDQDQSNYDSHILYNLILKQKNYKFN